MDFQLCDLLFVVIGNASFWEEFGSMNPEKLESLATQLIRLTRGGLVSS